MGQLCGGVCSGPGGSERKSSIKKPIPVDGLDIVNLINIKKNINKNLKYMLILNFAG